MAVWNETKYVLERRPDEPRALAYRGLVRLSMGQGDIAIELVERAVQGHPDFLDGYVHSPSSTREPAAAATAATAANPSLTIVHKERVNSQEY